MNAFYSKISEFRIKCIESGGPSSFFFISSALYVKLMNAVAEFNSQEWGDVIKFESHVPGSNDELFHYLWFLNAKSRYECFVRKDYQSAMNLTNTISSLAGSLFAKDFEEDNLEMRSLIFILAINYTRLSFYTKKNSLCRERLSEFKLFFHHSQDCEWKSFPKDLCLLLNNYALSLIEQMNQEQKDYFLGKINKVEEKLKQQVS